MKIMDFVVAAVIGIVVGIPVYFIVDSYLLTEERFKEDIEVVRPISSGFSNESNGIFTNPDRTDYSSEVELNTKRNSSPFVSE